MIKNKMDITSPVLGRKKRCKRKIKRRILNNLVLDLDIKDHHNSFNSNSDKYSEATDSVYSEVVLDTETEIKKEFIKTEFNDLAYEHCKENKTLQEINNVEKSSNTSTQDFFSNASFSSIDRLCSNVIQKEKPLLVNEENTVKINSNHQFVKQECITEKENNTINISNNILERVAEIRRNQKPIKQSFKAQIDIPKELFTKSVRELELADISFKQKCKELNKPENSLNKQSFDKNELSDVNNKLLVKNSGMGNFSQFVPMEIMDDWDADKSLNVQKDYIKVQTLSDSCNVPEVIDADINFSTANGKGIAISEEFLKKSMKIYNEIEDEVQESSDILNLRKSNMKLIKSKPLVNGLRANKNLINYKNNLLCNGSPYNKNVLGLDNNFNMTDKLSRVNNKNSIISTNNVIDNVMENSLYSSNKYKENYNRKNISNQPSYPIIINSDISIKIEKNENEELDDVITCKQDIQNELSNSCHKLPIEDFRGENCEAENMEEMDNNGFMTAGGRGIEINEEKENYYSKIFNNLDEDILKENSFRDLKKRNLLKGNRNIKASITFNVEKEKVVLESRSSNVNNETVNFSSNNEKENNRNQFIIPNSTNVLKKLNHSTSTVNKNERMKSLNTLKEETSFKGQSLNGIGDESAPVNNDCNLMRSLAERKLLKNLKDCKSEENEKYVSALKQKIDNCEVKRPERCRSFGGFPMNEEPVTTSKLNRSDPNEESFINQPLKNGLSISQCFDSHSDSWLSKVEISHLNSSKVQSPVLKIKTEGKSVNVEKTENCPNDEENGEFSGFSFKECTENFRKYASFKRFFKKLSTYNTGLNVDIDKSVFSSNTNNPLKRELPAQLKSKVDAVEVNNKCNYLSTEVVPRVSKNEKVEGELDKGMEKRKHADTDSDTPLSTLKKPRIGSELQGRKLFYEEDNDFVKKTKGKQLFSPQISDEDNKDFLQNRQQAIFYQEKIIRKKKRTKVNISVGTLLRQRLIDKKKRISWGEFVGNAVPKSCSIEQIRQNGLDDKIVNVTASNATYYKFLSCNIVGNKRIACLHVDDGGSLVFDENGHAGVSEFSKTLLAMPGVDPKLLPMGWIENHYKWIIWKLASIDRIRFNAIKLPKMLTPERVVKELKYRYDREIDNVERPVLRKILEKDDVSSKRMVLCISSIGQRANHQEAEKDGRSSIGMPYVGIEATDGWYSIPLTIDNAMANYVSVGKIKEGTKIITYGAELLECTRGCFPLERPANVSLRIHTNSTRRARWDAKLGYQRISRPIPVNLADIVPSGGMIGEMTAVVARTYPLLYREKTPSGQSIYRNSRAEEKAASAHQRALELKVDAMYAEAEKNFEAKGSLGAGNEAENSQSQVRTRNQSQWHRDQRALKDKLESRMRQDLPPPRVVTAILKVRLFHGKAAAILSLWGSTEDSGYDIKEGETITVYNSFATGMRTGELQLMANRMTHMKKEPLLKLDYPRRSYVPIEKIGVPGFEVPFNELDTVGLVVSSGPAPYGMKNFEMVNLAQPRSVGGGSAYLSILFWNGITSFGYEGMLATGSLVACSNLEWRSGASWNLAVAYCTEKSVFTCNPRQPHLVKELRNLKALVQNRVRYASACAEEVQRELSKKPQIRPRQVGSASPWAPSPQEIRTPGGPSVKRRLEMLSCYGQPLDTSPNVILNDSSDRVKKDFTPVGRGQS